MTQPALDTSSVAIPPFPSSFDVDDFFNIDLLSSSVTVHPTTSSFSQEDAESSRSSSHSPSASSSHLPPTPPQRSFAPGIMGSSSAFSSLSTIDEDSIFNFAGYDDTTSSIDFLKPGSDPLAGLSNMPFDLFGAFDSGLAATSATIPNSGASASKSSAVRASASDSPAFAYTIDPQLMGTPAPSSDASNKDDAEDAEDESQNTEKDDDDDEALIVPIKVGGKGKARKGTLHSGGVVKKSSIGPSSIFGSLSNGDKMGKSEKDDRDMDDWRPSPEEYQKMSSKEKRQLRNKISARNFRVRRKGMPAPRQLLM